MSAIAGADDGCWSITGPPGHLSQSKWVRMVSETVEIRLYDGVMRVKAQFTFRNEGPAHTERMAFPEEGWGLQFNRFGGKARLPIRKIASKVDGQPVPLRRQKVKPDEDGEYAAVWLKDVLFAKGQTRSVEVDYSALNGDRGDYVYNIYRLKTGATWKGPIGKGTIVVDWTGLTGIGEFVLDANDRVWTAIGPRKARLTFRNEDPNWDLRMAWVNWPWNFTVDGTELPGSGATVDDYQPTKGSNADPWIQVGLVERLFDVEGDYLEPEDEDTRLSKGEKLPVFANGHFFWFEKKDKKHVMIDGERVLLSRPVDKDGYVSVLSLARALGGKCRYDARKDRLSIDFPMK